MLLVIACFALLMKTLPLMNVSEEEQRKRIFDKMTDPKSNSFFHFSFFLLKRIDVALLLAIFFSGVTKIDLYHIAMMYCFVTFLIFPKCFKRNFFIFLLFVNLIAWEKYLMSLLQHWIPDKSMAQKILQALGLGANFTPQGRYFNYPPKFQHWFVAFIAFVQYQIYRLLKSEPQVKRMSNLCYE